VATILVIVAEVSVGAGGASGSAGTGSGSLAETLALPSGASMSYTVGYTLNLVAQWQKVVVDIVKLRDYVLNPQHPRGKHKARVFEAKLGLGARDAQLLHEALLDAVRGRGERLRPGDEDDYGQRYLLDFEMTTDKGTAAIRSAWIIRRDETELRLTTCYVK
jgi:hypothetical protein